MEPSLLLTVVFLVLWLGAICWAWLEGDFG